MIARTTLAEIDTLRIGIDAAVERFRELVVPASKSRKASRASIC